MGTGARAGRGGRRGVLLGAPPAAGGLLLGTAGRARAAGRARPAPGGSFYDFQVEQFGGPASLGSLRGGVTVAVNVASA